MAPSFEAKYPSITRWVKEFGTVEIGYNPGTASFIRAIDKGRWHAAERDVTNRSTMPLS